MQVQSVRGLAADLGAGSLDMLGLAMRLEEALDIGIGDDESEGCATVGDALGVLTAKLANSVTG